MLDSMMTAVDAGFSYDGIVSVPQTGLEDAEYRFGLVASLRDSVVSRPSLPYSPRAHGPRHVTGSSSDERGSHLTRNS